MQASSCRSEQSARTVLAAVSLGYAVVVVDTTAVNVALPSVGSSLHAGSSSLQWVVDAYVLVFAALLVSAGALGDRLGSARTFVGGMIAFTAASVGCALAPTVGALITARAAQGIGAALLAPAAVAMISQAFPDQASRARATAIFVTAAGSPQAFGPVLGGLLVNALGWRAVFWINVPLAAGTLLLARRRLPRDQRRSTPLTPVGQGSLVVTCAAVIAVLIEARSGRPSFTVSAAAIGALGLAVFVATQRSSNPPIPVQVLRAPRFSSGILCGTMLFAAYYGLVFAITLDLQQAHHFSAFDTGLAFLPSALPIFALPAISAPLSIRIGPARLMLVGAVILSIGCLLLATPLSSSLAGLETGLALIGTGVGLVVAPQVSTVMATAPQDTQNLASGILNAGRQVGTALGVALTGTTYAAGNASLPFAATASMALGLTAVALTGRVISR
ncbi:MFS transporter [Kribbella sp. NPDC004536]|uniref:MFS transporter n=1 Tax=Kribbella sp. NPDC004536 TaxID=3364106 RepID=UPI0036B3146E